VLRLRQDNRGRHKLSPPWEGPYVVVEVLKPKPKSSPTLGTSNSYVASTLRKDFQVFFHIPDAPIGCTYVKFSFE
jgi:hypothetical protein